MSTLQIALVLVAVALLVWLLTRKRSSNAQPVAEDRIDTLTGWPPQATRVLSTAERVAFGRLVQALPEFMILAQVPLARFLNVPKRNSYADWLRRIGYQCVDFAVCDMAAQVVVVVELQTAQTSERSRKRLARISRTLRAANIPLQIWNEASMPTAESARDVLLPKVAPMPGNPAMTSGAKLGVQPVPGDAGAAPVVSTRNPFDDSRRDPTQDEVLEILEPPPSTWFDDLDSTPAPLNRH